MIKQRSTPFFALLVLFAVIFCSGTAFGKTLYVKPTGNSTFTGTTWSEAKQTVQSAIDTAVSGDEVWVASGTYVESIRLKDGVAVYGGFLGSESVREERNWKKNLTKTGGVTSPTGTAQTTRFDGFTVSGDVTCSKSSPTIANNTIFGGVSAFGSSAAPTITSNIIRNGYGDGVWCGCSAVISNNIIAGSGGGIYCESNWMDPVIGSITITGNTIVGNRVYGILIAYCCADIRNNIVAFNGNGLCIYDESTTHSYNCIYGNKDIDYEWCSAGVGEFSEDPRIVSFKYGDFHILPTSPCINRGDNSVVAAGSIDVEGKNRIIDSVVDIGADEYDGSTYDTSRPVICVGPSGNDANDGLTWVKAKKTVQSAIDSLADTGGDIWVKGGVYNNKIKFSGGVYIYGGFAGTETNINQRNWKANRTTLSSGVEISYSGCLPSAIDGFTIYGGILAMGSVPTICHNEITKSGTEIGGGIECESSSAVISDNLIYGNSASYLGGGIYCSFSSTTIVNNTIVANTAPYGCGGGIYLSASQSTISNNIVAFNTGGICTANSCEYVSYPSLSRNCVYGNTNGDYYCVEPGKTDIRIDPGLVSYAYGDYRLQSSSFCRDTGDDSAVASSYDIDGQTRIQGVHVDIGSDESDGTLWNISRPVVRVSLTGNDANDGSTWNLAKKTIQSAIDLAAKTGGEVWVEAGLYTENIKIPEWVYVYGGFAGNETGRDQRNWKNNITTIDGQSKGSIVTFTDAAGYTGSHGYLQSALDGFTIQNSQGFYGGGVQCCLSALIADNDIRNNKVSCSDPSGICYGGGIACFWGYPLIKNNQISGNHSTDLGGGIYCEYASPTVIGNVIKSNTTDTSCAAMYFGQDSSPVIVNNLIANNAATVGVGAIFMNNGINSLIANNTIVGNTAPYGASVYVSGDNIDTPIHLYNNIIAFNSNGIRTYNANEIVLKSNCVYNTGGIDYYVDDYCALTPGEGDIQADPLLKNFAGGDYHLTLASPCINRGLNGISMQQIFDMDGEGRVFGGIIDMGYDEFWPEKLAIADAKSAADGAVITGNDAIVTAAFPDYFYVESDKRASGIRVEKSGHGLSEGAKAIITGQIATNSNGERCIIADTVSPDGTGTVNPVGMTSKMLGGGKSGLQHGVMDGQGLNNIGLLVRCWGKPSIVDGDYYISDGSGTSVKLILPSGVTIDQSWQYIGVTGISSCEKVNNQLVRVLRVRKSEDIDRLDQ